MDQTQFPFLILFLFLFIALAFILIIGNAEFPSIRIIQEQCTESSVRSCTNGPCNGTQECINGKWTSCSWQVICDPGSTAPCNMDMCGNYYKICNECGSGYENCISGQEG